MLRASLNANRTSVPLSPGYAYESGFHLFIEFNKEFIIQSQVNFDIEEIKKCVYRNLNISI